MRLSQEAPMNTDAGCIFCKIIAGAIPCHKIMENDHVIADT